MYVDKEDRDVMDMCHENRRRSGMTTTVGYLVAGEQARRFAAFEAAEKRRRGGGWQNVGWMLVAALGILAAAMGAIA